MDHNDQIDLVQEIYDEEENHNLNHQIDEESVIGEIMQEPVELIYESEEFQPNPKTQEKKYEQNNGDDNNDDDSGEENNEKLNRRRGRPQKKIRTQPIPKRQAIHKEENAEEKKGRLDKNKLARLYREFSRQRYCKYRHKFPRMNESELVSKIIREWEQMSMEEKIELYGQYIRDKFIVEGEEPRKPESESDESKSVTSIKSTKNKKVIPEIPNMSTKTGMRVYITHTLSEFKGAMQNAYFDYIEKETSNIICNVNETWHEKEQTDEVKEQFYRKYAEYRYFQMGGMIMPSMLDIHEAEVYQYYLMLVRYPSRKLGRNIPNANMAVLQEKYHVLDMKLEDDKKTHPFSDQTYEEIREALNMHNIKKSPKLFSGRIASTLDDVFDYCEMRLHVYSFASATAIYRCIYPLGELPEEGVTGFIWGNLRKDRKEKLMEFVRREWTDIQTIHENRFKEEVESTRTRLTHSLIWQECEKNEFFYTETENKSKLKCKICGHLFLRRDYITHATDAHRIVHYEREISGNMHKQSVDVYLSGEPKLKNVVAVYASRKDKEERFRELSAQYKELTLQRHTKFGWKAMNMQKSEAIPHRVTADMRDRARKLGIEYLDKRFYSLKQGDYLRPGVIVMEKSTQVDAVARDWYAPELEIEELQDLSCGEIFHSKIIKLAGKHQIDPSEMCATFTQMLCEMIHNKEKDNALKHAEEMRILEEEHEIEAMSEESEHKPINVKNSLIHIMTGHEAKQKILKEQQITFQEAIQACGKTPLERSLCYMKFGEMIPRYTKPFKMDYSKQERVKEVFADLTLEKKLNFKLTDPPVHSNDSDRKFFDLQIQEYLKPDTKYAKIFEIRHNCYYQDYKLPKCENLEVNIPSKETEKLLKKYQRKENVFPVRLTEVVDKHEHHVKTTHGWGRGLESNRKIKFKEIVGFFNGSVIPLVLSLYIGDAHNHMDLYPESLVEGYGELNPVISTLTGSMEKDHNFSIWGMGPMFNSAPSEEEANLSMVRIWTESDGLEYILVAKRNIVEGEELTWWYGDNYFTQNNKFDIVNIRTEVTKYRRDLRKDVNYQISIDKEWAIANQKLIQNLIMVGEFQMYPYLRPDAETRKIVEDYLELLCDCEAFRYGHKHDIEFLAKCKPSKFLKYVI